MEIYRWVQGSLILNAISAFLKPNIFEGSIFCRLAVSFSKNVARVFQGSFLRYFSFDRNWQEQALAQSRFARVISETGPTFMSAIEYINRLIRNSLFFQLSSRIEKEFVEHPLMVLSLILFPALFVSTAIKAIFSSFMVRDLIIRLVLMGLLFLGFFIDVSLKRLLSKSIVGKAISRILDEKAEVLFSKNSMSNIREESRPINGISKLILVSIGVVIGLFHYFLPTTTFIKLFGIIFLSITLYFRPWWGLFAIAFILPLTATVYSVAISGMTFISLILNYNKQKIDIPYAAVPAVFFFITAVMATIFSVMRAESVNSLLLYMGYFMTFYSAAILFRNKLILKTALFLQIISACILSFYGIYQYFFVKVPTAMAWVDVKQFPELATRVYATLENPNVLAEYLVLVISLTLGFIWSSRKLGQKALLTALGAVMALCLVLTFSRGGWLGFAFAFLIFAVLVEPRLFILLFAIALISPFFMPSVVLNRIASIGSLEDSSNAFRVTIWIAALRMIKDYWLTGVGLGLTAFSRVYRDYMIAGTPALHAHNLYLEMGIEMGIAGILAFFWTITAGMSRALDKIKERNWSSFILAGSVGALGGNLLHGLFDYVWFSPRVVMAFWLVFGMMSALTSSFEEKAVGKEI